MGKKKFGEPASARDMVDHLMFGAMNLDEGITWVERIVGVRASGGGSHPGAGTRNALLSLGARQYLEIIAPDPLQKSESGLCRELCALASPQMITWAAATDDIEAVAMRAADAGFEIEGPAAGSRERPDGRILRWKTLRVRTEHGSAIPFFIEWAPDMMHPSGDSPSGCRLVDLEVEHPHADRLRSALLALAIEARVKEGGAFKLRATLQTPQGRIELV